LATLAKPSKKYFMHGEYTDIFSFILQNVEGAFDLFELAYEASRRLNTAGSIQPPGIDLLCRPASELYNQEVLVINL